MCVNCPLTIQTTGKLFHFTPQEFEQLLSRQAFGIHRAQLRSGHRTAFMHTARALFQ